MKHLSRTLSLLLVASASIAQASRAHMPMGHYIRQADLIVVADTRKGGPRGYDTLLKVSEVLQGDQELVGEVITLSARTIRSTADAHVPAEVKGVGVLLKAGWKDAQRWPVLEAYQKPHEIEALRMLVPVYKMRDERDRLVVLRTLFADGNPVCRQQLFADLEDMSDPAGLPLIAEWFASFEPEDQRRLVRLLGRMGDLRGVPTLIDAMASPDRYVGASAAVQLSWYFPGAPGVTEAFRRALDREHLARTAAQYLVKRDPDPKLKVLAAAKETRYVQARRLLAEGHTAAAVALYLEIVEDPKENALSQISVARKIVHLADEETKRRIREAVLLLLEREADTDNFIFRTDAAVVLRGLHHPDCLGPLLRILPWPKVSYRKATRTATIGIRELGPEARRKAAADILRRLESAQTKRPPGEDPTRPLLQLAWLGTQADFAVAPRVMPARYKASWNDLRPLLAIAECDDEAGLLRRLLSEGSTLPTEAREWILFRLGDLRDQRAVEPLARSLAEERAWQLTETAVEALTRIGGPAVEEQMTRLLTHEDRAVRRDALKVLFQLQPERALDVARQMLPREDSLVRRTIISHLGRFGTLGDLELLLPWGNYWTADRSTHNDAVTAIARIRGRHNYDVNGPIGGSGPGATEGAEP
jgi:HEAT repeat protein